MGDWRPIKSNPKYLVSDDGEVINSKTSRKLTPVRKSTGYTQVVLYGENGRQQKHVHRLVAESFLDNPNDYPMINHIDGNKSNNRASNLEWCTGSQNMKHAYHTGLQKPIAEQIKESLAKAVDSRRRPIRNVETGVVYRSIVECAKNECVVPSTISYHLNKKHRFEYVD